MQLTMLLVELHVAPFVHGLLKQGLISWLQSEPVKPAEQKHFTTALPEDTKDGTHSFR